ncbi:Mediator of rna polymerase ii transcription subunit 15a [Heracleum sosnowskyi]|uniref:Mediator of rna polymerase ii transcription subunit 15a n=1 Tax=Heracleum sosnowskyi TaxID=360622 RepID=A0AAD8MHV3_9APIA|nr:Mediator of rna polymerase ii transcription subunit 15a [Heracleum sosnowskyi]
MDNNNMRSTQGGESTNDDGGDWRSQMQDESRKRIFNHIMNKLKRRFPLSGQEGFQELRKIAMRFEEKIYTSATSRVDYFKKISANMLAMERRYPTSNAIPPNSTNIGQNPQDPGSQSMQSQSGQLLLQNIGNNIAAAGMQGSSQTNIPSVNRSFNTQSIPPISGVLQNSVPSAIGQGIPYNVFAYSQRQTGRQQQGVSNIHHHMLLPTQQQQHLVGQSTATNIQQNQIIGQQNRIPDMQQNQQRLPSQQNILSNQQSQQLMGLPNNFAHMYQQQLGTQEQQQHHQLWETYPQTEAKKKWSTLSSLQFLCLEANHNSMQPSSSMLQQQQDQLQQNQNLKEFQHHQMQQNLLIAPSKASTPLQPVYSAVVVPSPSTPVVPSHMLGEPEKVNCGPSSLSKAGNLGHQTVGTLVPAQSLAIGTPGKSASPLLDEFTSPEDHHAIPATVVSAKSTATEEPLKRLNKVVKSMSSKDLTASVCDIRAVVSMTDKTEGSRVAVCEDLVKMAKCPLQARNLITEDETTKRKENKRCTTATPSDVSSPGSLSDSFKQLNGLYLSDLDSTATSTSKKPRIENGGGSFSSK